MYRNVRAASSKILQCFRADTEQRRSTYILRRKFMPLLNRLGSDIKRPLRRKDYYYELVEDTCEEGKTEREIDLILLKAVEEVGVPGDIVKISKYPAYEYFILSGAATYATPENIAKYGARSGENRIPGHIHKILTELSYYITPIFVQDTTPWTLEAWHVRVALRKCGIICDEKCIEMPEKPISGPNYEYEKKDFVVKLTINEKYPCFVRCRIFHMMTSTNEYYTPFNEQFYLEPSVPLFPEDKALLQSLPSPQSRLKDGLPKIL